MLKLVIEEIEALPARAVFIAALFCSVATFQVFSGPGHPPVPARKPVQVVATAPAIKTGNFLDFSRTFKFLAKAPVRGPAAPQEPVSGPLSYADAALYRGIFDLQADGKMADADQLIERLSDRRLMGHVLFQRYTHPVAYKSRFEELKLWLDQYAGQPGTDRIRKMAASRMPKGYKGALSKGPDVASASYESKIMTAAAGESYQSKRPRSEAQKNNAQKIKRGIITLVQAQKMDQALLKLKGQAPALDSIEYDMLLGNIAAGYLYQRQMERAYQVALASVHRSGTYVPLSGWVAGMAAWDGKRYKEAAKFFEITARSPYASGWMTAAGSYWAARAHRRAGNIFQVNTWLDAAARHPRTFYGLLATQALGRDFDFNWHVPAFTKGHSDLLAGTPEGSRAMALVAAGQPQRAEDELLRIDTGEDEGMRSAILAYAAYANLPALAMKLGGAMAPADDEGKFYDAALYPVVPWEPGNGYTVDPALLNAIARQESRFDPYAESPSGALGLMQIMPKTASAMSDDLKMSDKEKAYRLKDPQTNLEIGQRYIQTLLKDKNIKGDILKLVVAYNAGPGNLSRWEKQWEGVEDPLMFIELIPSSETRSYVEKVLSNYWMYRLRDGMPTPTLDALAQGRPALYADNFGPKGIFQIASR